MSISPAQVRRIAALARLELDDDEVDRLAGELSDILAHFEALEGAEEAEPLTAQSAERAEGTAVGGAEPAEGAEAGGRAPLRADEPGADRLDVEPGAMAPEWTAGFFTVPRVVGGGAEEESEEGRE